VGRRALRREQRRAVDQIVVDGLQQLPEPIEIQRLAEVVHRAELDRFDRAVHLRVRRHEDHPAFRLRLADGPQDIEPADLGHAQIDDRHVGSAVRDRRDRVPRAGIRVDVETGGSREPLDEAQHARFVIDDEQHRRPDHQACSPARSMSIAALCISSRSSLNGLSGGTSPSSSSQ